MFTVLRLPGDCLSLQPKFLPHVSILTRDQPNSRGKMRDFTVEFLKCAKFHGKLTERI